MNLTNLDREFLKNWLTNLPRCYNCGVILAGPRPVHHPQCAVQNVMVSEPRSMAERVAFAGDPWLPYVLFAVVILSLGFLVWLVLE